MQRPQHDDVGLYSAAAYIDPGSITPSDRQRSVSCVSLLGKELVAGRSPLWQDRNRESRSPMG